MQGYEQLGHPVALTVFILTLFLPVMIGFLTLRRTRNQSDFFIGGRTMDKFVVALSAVSSGRSSWLVLGVSGMAYTMGASAVWAVAGYILAELFQFIYIGRKLRTETELMNALTLLDYFESKFNDRKHLIRITGAVIIGIFISAYVAAQLSAGARALSAALDLPLLLALGCSVFLILLYMMMGGYIAVAYNDVIRAVIMIFGLVIFPIAGFVKIGGLNALLRILSELDPAAIDPFALGAGAAIGFIGIGLGSPGQPHILVRYMSIDNPDRLRQSTIIGTFWNVVMAWGALFIGLIGRAIIPDIQNLPDGDSEMIYLVLCSRFFGPALYGLLIGGIFAAILSTADSQLLVVASTFVRDIYEKMLHPDLVMEEAHKLRLSRIVVLLSGLLAMGLAIAARDLIFWLVLFAWGGLGASFGPSIILALYWKRASRIGIASGMATGSLATVIWKLYLKSITGIYELIPAFILSLCAIVIFSMIFPSKRND